MKAIVKAGFPALPAALLISLCSAPISQADTTVIEERTVKTNIPIVRVQPQDVIVSQEISTSQGMSNYRSRLAHLREQINLGVDRGWLTPDEANNLRQWRAQLVRTNATMLISDGGKLTPEHARQMERFVNSLALMINRQISLGSSVTVH